MSWHSLKEIVPNSGLSRRFVSDLSYYFATLVYAGNEKGEDKDGGEPSQSQRIGAKVRNEQ